MVHRHFENPEANSRGVHLHLQIPAIGLFAHPEPLERVAPNGPKWTHVGVTNAVKKAQD